MSNSLETAIAKRNWKDAEQAIRKTPTDIHDGMLLEICRGAVTPPPLNIITLLLDTHTFPKQEIMEAAYYTATHAPEPEYEKCFLMADVDPATINLGNLIWMINKDPELVRAAFEPIDPQHPLAEMFLRDTIARNCGLGLDLVRKGITLTHPANIWNSFLRTIEENHLELAAHLAGLPVDDPETLADIEILLAAVQGNLPMLKSVITEVDPENTDMTAIWCLGFTAGHINLETAQLLTEMADDPEEVQHVTLDALARHNNLPVFQLITGDELLDEEVGLSAAEIAADTGHETIARKLAELLDLEPADLQKLEKRIELALNQK